MPEESLAIFIVALTAIGSAVALRELDEFTSDRGTAIVVVTGVVAIQTTSDQDVLTAIAQSDVLSLLAIGGIYLTYQMVQAWPQPDEQTTVVVAGDQGGNAD